jgi:hypothetical protein
MAYDLIARVGLARFLECRQAQEIQLELSRQSGMEVPVRTINQLSQKFVAYFQVVHQQSIKLLRREMYHQRGGYVLHVDGTCEEGSRVLLVCLDSLSGQVLESRKISSENVAEVEQVLRDVRRDWGCPLAVVHDLRNSLITAVGSVFPGVAQFVCHFQLRALCRSLKKFAAAQDSGEHVLGSILDGESSTDIRQLSTPQAVKGTVHALASWILAFSHHGDGYGFPFDVPYLTLYDRVLEVDKVLRAASRFSARPARLGPWRNAVRWEPSSGSRRFLTSSWPASTRPSSVASWRKRNESKKSSSSYEVLCESVPKVGRKGETTTVLRIS